MVAEAVETPLSEFLKEVRDLSRSEFVVAYPHPFLVRNVISNVVLDEETVEADAKERALRVHEALITLRDDGDPSLLRRPPVERYDFLGEDRPEPLDDLFDGHGLGHV